MRTLLKALLVFIIVGMGFSGYLILKASRPTPSRQHPSQTSTLVEVTISRASSEPVIVTAMGTIIPAQSVTLQPEVNGRIVYQSPKLVPGGRFRKGEILAKIFAADYELALKQKETGVLSAQMELARERGLKSVAEREWNLIRDEVKPTREGKKLALREIQLENAQAAVTAAKSALDQAKLMLERTVIKAPFNSVITEEFVDVGQVVSSASRIATLVGTDKFWVQVSVPLDRLNWIFVPGVNHKTGSPAKVTQDIGPGQRVVRSGRVIKLLSTLDPKGKMARLLVEIDDPMGILKKQKTDLPLMLGGFVKVRLQGPQVKDAIALPRKALREQSQVWVMDSSNRLAIRQIHVVWSDENMIYVRGNLRPNEKIITSRIAAPIQGMLLHAVQHNPAHRLMNSAEIKDSSSSKATDGEAS